MYQEFLFRQKLDCRLSPLKLWLLTKFGEMLHDCRNAIKESNPRVQSGWRIFIRNMRILAHIKIEIITPLGK